MKKIFFSAILLMCATAANAVVIEGTFSLPGDINPLTGAASGPTLVGTFTTADTDSATVSPTGVTFVDIDVFDIVVPPAPGQALTVADFSNGPFAIISGVGASSVIGLVGNAATVVGGVTYSLDLTVDVNNVAQGTFTSSGGNTPGGTFSGNQVIPEPSAIALLGAGLFAFGFARRAKKQAA